MKTSQEIGQLALALAKAQGKIRAALKEATNPHYKSRYADLASVYEACKEQLASHEITVVQGANKAEYGWVLVTRVMHKDQWIESEFPLLAKDMTSQAMGSAMTYARRYSLSAMIGIVTEEDDDGEQAMGRLVSPLLSSLPKPIVDHQPMNKNQTPSQPDAKSGHPGLGISDKQRKMLWAKLKGLDYSDDGAKEFLASHSGKEHSSDWTRQDFEKVLNAIEVIEKNNPQLG